MIPEDEARKLLEELGISNLPIIPVEICQTLEIDYREGQLSSIDGFLIIEPRTGHGLICINSSIRERGRKNFTCAHELGHLCLDSHSQNEFYCSKDVIELQKQTIPPLELRANQFAAELLMPTHLYQDLVADRSPGWDSIQELAAISQTSILSTAIKFVDITEDPCALIISSGQMMSWFRNSKTFGGFIDFQSKILSPYSHAYKASQGLTPPNKFETVKADNWVSGKRIKPHIEILEWTLPLNSYGQVFTLLFDEEDELGCEEDDGGHDDDDVEWEPPTFHKSKRK